MGKRVGEEKTFVLTSLLPLPNPFTTVPFTRSGKGGSGPASGPATGGRGASGRIVFENAGEGGGGGGGGEFFCS